ncbi:ankyrin repeat domain-containing protein [Nostoc sp.]|uniref:ankyrin repeat domain-containing protein n=1 Tax=Nostoc sp. TaxID=1180 RepID=UPI002FF5B289
MQKIHIYAQQGDIAGVARKIANGVDIERLDEYSQQTPLMCAVSSANAGIDMIRFLLEHGANVNAVQQESQNTVLAGGGEMHFYCEQALLEDGSKQSDIRSHRFRPDTGKSLIKVCPMRGFPGLLELKGSQ